MNVWIIKNRGRYFASTLTNKGINSINMKIGDNFAEPMERRTKGISKFYLLRLFYSVFNFNFGNISLINYLPILP